MFIFCSHLQSVLPANGAPVARQRTSRLKELYNDYVTERTLRNWKFWIVSKPNKINEILEKEKLIYRTIFHSQLGLIFEPLLNSYNSTVSVASMDELHRTTMLWVDQNCSLIEIRPGNCLIIPNVIELIDFDCFVSSNFSCFRQITFFVNHNGHIIGSSINATRRSAQSHFSK